MGTLISNWLRHFQLPFTCLTTTYEVSRFARNYPELVLKKCSEQLQIQDGLCYITFTKFDEIQIQDAVMVPSWQFHLKDTLKNDMSILSKTPFYLNGSHLDLII